MTTLTRQRAQDERGLVDEFIPASWSIIPFGADCRLTDDLLERVGSVFPTRKIERTARGELAMSPPNAHGGSPEYEAEIAVQMGIWRRAGGRGIIAAGTKGYEDEETNEVHAPDISWMSPEQVAAAPKPGKEQGMFVGAPAFAIEIMSKRDSIPDHIRRCRAWIQRGVQVIWMIDPFNRTLRIFRDTDPEDAEPELLDAVGRIPVGPLMPGFELDFDEVWAVWE